MSIPSTLISCFIGLVSCGDIVLSDSEIIVAHRSRSAQGRVHFITTRPSVSVPKNLLMFPERAGWDRGAASTGVEQLPSHCFPWAQPTLQFFLSVRRSRATTGREPTRRKQQGT